MKCFLLFIVLLPSIGHAHPGIGIVKDSKGRIYYTDLEHVWKIEDSEKKVVVPNVHTHELYIDQNDNLYGEGNTYDAAKEKFYHYYWVYRPSGNIDTVISMREAYIQEDFSLAKEKQGNEFYTKQYIKDPDTTHIFRRTPQGKETIFATGNFKGVKWLHPQDDGTLLYVLRNSVYRVNAGGKVSLVKDSIGNETPSFHFSRPANITLWSVWEDKAKNVYVAVFSDQAVKKIDANGQLSVYYKSSGNWTPLHGVFDKDNRLWVLEGSDKNEVRVTVAGTKESALTDTKKNHLLLIVISSFFAAGLLLHYAIRKNKFFIFDRQAQLKN